MNDVIVVEGLHDEIKIKSVYPDAFCVITNGSEISDETLRYIKKLSESHNIIIFTDPDSPGERIRNKVPESLRNSTLTSGSIPVVSLASPMWRPVSLRIRYAYAAFLPSE